ncbi:DNA-binding protein, partial [Pseudomonas aeruginosa]
MAVAGSYVRPPRATEATMSEWFSAQQLAGLPGLGSTDRAIQLRAKREGWTSQRRVGTKAIEYHISALPKE